MRTQRGSGGWTRTRRRQRGGTARCKNAHAATPPRTFARGGSLGCVLCTRLVVFDVPDFIGPNVASEKPLAITAFNISPDFTRCTIRDLLIYTVNLTGHMRKFVRLRLKTIVGCKSGLTINFKQ
jgi:hypothetical protein